MKLADRLYLRRVAHAKSYVCVDVFEDAKPVLLVSRADDDWCFLCGGDHDDYADDKWLFVVGMGHVLERDPSLLELRALPPDVEAERESVGAPWETSASGS